MKMNVFNKKLTKSLNNMFISHCQAISFIVSNNSRFKGYCPGKITDPSRIGTNIKETSADSVSYKIIHG